MSEMNLVVEQDTFPIAGGFTISRGTKTKADVVVATITDGSICGRGECTPYPRYGESVDGVMDLVRGQADAIAAGLWRDGLQDALPAGAARNALDCAMWDFEAKKSGKRAWELAGIASFKPLLTAYTISLGAPDEMAAAAKAAGARPLLKLKLGGAGDEDRIRAIRAAVPETRLIVDANEAWTPDILERLLAVSAEERIELVEQPLPAADDGLLASIDRPVTVCADESAHDRHGLEELATKYDAINIKIDKTGGLTEALALADEAAARGMDIMVGCMLASSLAMAPAMVVAQKASVVDLDGPLLLDSDRPSAITFDGSIMSAPAPELWG